MPFILIILALVASAQAQTRIEFDDLVIVATQSERSLADTPATVHLFGPQELTMRLQPKAVSDALAAVPGVLVQKTGHGMTSPFLRGLTAQRVVLVADGMRINNSILREGPNQYWNQLDGYFYDEMEVLMGPASFIYGSDAIGGVVSLSSGTGERGEPEAGLQWHGGELLLRVSSAESASSEHLNTRFAIDDQWTFRLGLTRQDFGELRSGDSSDNPNTNYEQWGGNARATYWVSDDVRIVLGLDHFDQDDVDRVHKTTAYLPWHGTTAASDTRRTFDHDRQNAFARLEVREHDGWYEELDLSLVHQHLRERLRSDRFLSKGRIERRETRVDTKGLTLRLRTPQKASGRWTIGANYYLDRVSSWGENNDSVRPQGQVADDSDYQLFWAYLQNELPLNDRFELITGLAYTYADMKAGTVNFSSGVDSLSGSWDAVTGGLRLLYRALPDERLNLFAGIAQGFRAPNLSDATRDGEFGGGDEAPTADLGEEHFTTFELGAKSRTPQGYWQASIYHTLMRDRIGRLEKPDNTKRNLDEGFIQGIEAAAGWNFQPNWQLFGRIAWQEGREDHFFARDAAQPGAISPVSRMQPLNGQLGLRWENLADACWAEFVVDMAGKQDKLTLAEASDNRFPPSGTPGYAVYHLRAGIRVAANTDLTVALENIGDHAYRIHGSGVNETGRSLVATLRIGF
ncbi:MAG: hemoglobin/transferrin/lactoferrin receptor protein [Rhodothermales bacterium]|jgi:hemoglobin/transferrin/lactoferrin receptor protein